MSQRHVEIVLGRLITDGAFLEQFVAEPGGTCGRYGLELTPVELAAVRQIDVASLRALAVTLDPRIKQAAVADGLTAPSRRRSASGRFLDGVANSRTGSGVKQ